MQKKQYHKHILSDFGFGTKLIGSDRFINKDGSLNIERKGYRIGDLHLYQWLVTASWSRFLLFIVLSYIGLNLIFAVFYTMAGLEGLTGMPKGTWHNDFSNAFFFSIQTFTAVGYGAMYPNNFIINVISSFNALVGLMSFALATGLLFVRFSRPTARIGYSKNILITPYQNMKGLMFRIVNRRRSQLLEVHMRVVMTWLDKTKKETSREFKALKLERNYLYMLPLNWTVVHPITIDSPLFGKTKKELEDMNVEFMILLKAYDETFTQTVHFNTSYTKDDLRWNKKFVPMYYTNEAGGTVLELDKVSFLIES